MKRDSIANTFVVAGGLCIVCSLLVSGAAVMLKPLQTKNQKLDQKRNILAAAGLLDDDMSASDVEAMFPTDSSSAPDGYWIKLIIVDLESGQVVTDEYESPSDFDQFRAAKTEEGGDSLEKANDLAQLKAREKRSQVYLVMNGDNPQPEVFVFPVRGKGLWSTLYGFLAVASDLNTIKGLTFYSHGETPGLGGEVDNPRWKSQWSDKLLYEVDENGDPIREEVKVAVVKGLASEPDQEYKVDGLSGATITSKGVTDLLRFWMGPNGFGNYIQEIEGGESGNNGAGNQVNAGSLEGAQHG